MKFVGPVNSARDPLVCTIHGKSQQSLLGKKKKKQANTDVDVGSAKRTLNSTKLQYNQE